MVRIKMMFGLSGSANRIAGLKVIAAAIEAIARKKTRWTFISSSSFATMVRN